MWEGPPPPKTLSDAFEHLHWLRQFLGELEVDTMSGGTALQHVEFFSKVERMGVAGAMLLVPKVEECFEWRQEGHKTAASFLADKLGTSVATAGGVIETAKQLTDLPDTARCLHYGDFSLPQVKAIASAATVHPGAEGELIEWAARSGLKGLQTRCERTNSPRGRTVRWLERRPSIRADSSVVGPTLTGESASQPK